MGKNFTRAALVCALASPPAVAQADPPIAHSSTTPAAPTPGMRERLSRHDLRVLAFVHHANREEMLAGRLAEQRGSTPEVRRYGRMLIEDHRNNDDQLLAFVQSQGRQLPELAPRDEDDAMDMREHEQAMARLRGLRGAAFDREFLRAMIAAHDATIARLETDVTKVDNPDLAQMLRAALPVLHKHLDVARSMMQRLRM